MPLRKLLVTDLQSYPWLSPLLSSYEMRPRIAIRIVGSFAYMKKFITIYTTPILKNAKFKAEFF